MTLDERAGLDPNADRLNVLPYPRGALKGGRIDWRDWVSPEWFASLKRSFVLPEHVRQGGAATAEDALEFALGIAGAGALSKVGRLGRRLPRKGPARRALAKKQLKPVAPDVERLNAARAGIERALAGRTSVPAAITRADVGPITIDYGTAQWGLAHIIARRNADGIDGLAFVRERLPEVLARGRLHRLRGPANARRAEIILGDDQASLSLYRDGIRETWVLTAFGKMPGGAGGTGGVSP
jgi:hypothetical protein